MNKFVGKYYIVGTKQTFALHKNVFAFKVLECTKKNYKLQLYKIENLNLYQLEFSNISKMKKDKIFHLNYSYGMKESNSEDITTISKADFSILINHLFYETKKRAIMKTILHENLKFNRDKIMAP
jgi:hypothetical protein